MAGKHRHHAFIFPNKPITDELANPRNRGRGRRLTTNSITPDHCLRICDLLLADRDHATTSLAHRTPGLLPRNRRTDLDRGRQGLWMLFVTERFMTVVVEKAREWGRTFSLN